MRFTILVTVLLATTQAHACSPWLSFSEFDECRDVERRADAQTDALNDIAKQLRDDQHSEPLLDANEPFRR